MIRSHGTDSMVTCVVRTKNVDPLSYIQYIGSQVSTAEWMEWIPLNIAISSAVFIDKKCLVELTCNI